MHTRESCLTATGKARIRPQPVICQARGGQVGQVRGTRETHGIGEGDRWGDKGTGGGTREQVGGQGWTGRCDRREDR